MRDFLKSCGMPAIWVLFFATTVYGHIALKIAVDRRPVLAALVSVWGWSACLAWGVSCLLWAFALSEHRLQQANALSSLRYVLIGLAAWGWLGERMSGPQAIGMVLIMAGILLAK